MLPTERVPYSAITDRPPLSAPEGVRLIVWIIVNIEEWDPQQTMPRTVLTPPAGTASSPDIPNWCWHEYGNRVGFWRLLAALDRVKVPAVLAVNGTAAETYRPITDAALSRGWELMGHGFTQRNMQKVDDEATDIARTAAAIERVAGAPPAGWLGPGLTETWHTPDLLKEAGYRYVADWVLDDEPVWLKTRAGPLLNVPYTQECNDVAMMLIQHHAAREYRDRALDQFEQLYGDGAHSPRVMALVVHPYIMGAPHRARYFAEAVETIASREGVAVWTGAEIASWFAAQRPPEAS